MINVNQRINYVTTKFRDYQIECINGKNIHKLDTDLVLHETNQTEFENIDEILAQTSDDERILHSLPEKILNALIPSMHKKINENYNESDISETFNKGTEIFESLNMNKIFHYKDRFEFEFMNLIL